MNNTVTLNELVALLAERCSDTVDKSLTENFILKFFNNVASALQTEEHVKIDGLGTFTRDTTSNKVSFIPAQELADKINEPFSFFEAVELDDKYVDEKEDEPTVEVVEESENEPASEPVIISSPKVETEVMSETQPEVLPPPIPEASKQQAVEETMTEKNQDIETILGEEYETSHAAESTEDKADALKESEPKPDNGSYAEQDSGSWHLPWWIPGLVGLFIGFAIGYGINLVSLPETEDYDDAADEVEQMDQLLSEAKSETQEESTVQEVAPVNETPVPEKKPEPAVSQSTKDTVRSGYYLTSMARKYYGDTNFWCYIYEENKQKLGHPNKIPAGTEVIIPSAEKYGIDKNNPESIQRAKAKVAEINARYK